MTIVESSPTLGFSPGSPRDSAIRGSDISIRRPDGYRIDRALIEEMNVIPDFREPDNIRLGFAPSTPRLLRFGKGLTESNA